MLIEIFRAGGVVMYPLLVFSIVNLALAIHLVTTFWQFAQGLSSLENKTALNNFIKDSISRSYTDPNQEWQKIYAMFIMPYENRVYWLQANAGLATLLGLFGTVLGIYSSFAEMKSAGKVSLDILAGGISEAIITTIFGLVIAIPSLLVFHYLKTVLDLIELKTEILLTRGQND